MSGRRGGGYRDRRGGSRVPPGLTGREIGLYFRDRARARKHRELEEPSIRLGPSVDVPPGILAKVQRCLRNFDECEKDQQVCQEFLKSFRHVLDVNFEGFIGEAQAALKSSTGSTDNSACNKLLKAGLSEKCENEVYRERFESRQSLPAMKQKENILAAIEENQVVLIVGSTGCGKTTQVPQILLDEYIKQDRGSECRIVCTQPRRISAVSVAERVAYERCEKLGNSVGYQIRLESMMPREQGSILYCTTGILLQKMQTDPLLKGVTFVILDEIHERNTESDLLMAILKEILLYRRDLRLILMSATVKEQDFYKYFDMCFTLRIEGTLFPVEVYYLEDILQETKFQKFKVPGAGFGRQSNKRHKGKQRQEVTRDQEYSIFIEPYLRSLGEKYDQHVLQSLRCSDSEGCANLEFLEHLIFYIAEHKPPGAILVFLPSYERISKLHTALTKPTNSEHNRLVGKLQVHPLHSMMPTVNQKQVFERPPEGMRKVILSTILAETSVTIDDIVYVINAGRTKLSNYNVEANIQSLDEVWVTKANTAQRRGRAGRVQPGICYNLFTRAREEQMAEAPTPEIARSRLESIILNLKLFHIDNVSEFMQTLITVPHAKAVANGIALLTRVGALDHGGVLTPLGMHLARLPIDPQMAKMILMAALFRCLDPITSAAAALSHKSPFQSPLGLEQKANTIKRDLAENSRSDHLLMHNVIEKYREARRQHREGDYCYRNFLSLPIMHQLENMKQQFGDLLKGAKFLEAPDTTAAVSNINSKNIPLLRAIIASGLYPNMAHMKSCRRPKNHVKAIQVISTPEEKRVQFHPCSVNCDEGTFESNYFVYFLKQRSSSTFLMDASMIFPMALLIFGDGIERGCTPNMIPYISVARSYYFRCEPETAALITDLRHRLEWLLQVKALRPSPIALNSREEYLIKAIQILLSFDDPCYYEDNYDEDSDNDASDQEYSQPARYDFHEFGAAPNLPRYRRGEEENFADDVDFF